MEFAFSVSTITKCSCAKCPLCAFPTPKCLAACSNSTQQGTLRLVLPALTTELQNILAEVFVKGGHDWLLGRGLDCPREGSD